MSLKNLDSRFHGNVNLGLTSVFPQFYKTEGVGRNKFAYGYVRTNAG